MGFFLEHLETLQHLNLHQTLMSSLYQNKGLPPLGCNAPTFLITHSQIVGLTVAFVTLIGHATNLQPLTIRTITVLPYFRRANT